MIFDPKVCLIFHDFHNQLRSFKSDQFEFKLQIYQKGKIKNSFELNHREVSLIFTIVSLDCKI